MGIFYPFHGCLGRLMSSTAYEHLPTTFAASSRAIGVVRVVVQAANIEERLLLPRPFINIRVQGRTDVRTTASLDERTNSPNWISQSSFTLIYSLQEALEFEVMNHHRIRRPSLIGYAVFPLSALADDPRKIGEEKPIIKQGDEINGTLLFDVFYYPATTDEKHTLSSCTGIATLQLHDAKGLNWTQYSRKPDKLVATVSLGWSESVIHKTAPSSSLDPPRWNSTYEFLCLDKTSTTVVVKIFDESSKDPSLYGHITLSLDELLTAQIEGREWWPLSGCRDGQLRMTTDWKTIEMGPRSVYMQ